MVPDNTVFFYGELQSGGSFRSEEGWIWMKTTHWWLLPLCHCGLFGKNKVLLHYFVSCLWCLHSGSWTSVLWNYLFVLLLAKFCRWCSKSNVKVVLYFAGINDWWLCVWKRPWGLRGQGAKLVLFVYWQSPRGFGREGHGLGFVDSWVLLWGQNPRGTYWKWFDISWIKLKDFSTNSERKLSDLKSVSWETGDRFCLTSGK